MGRLILSGQSPLNFSFCVFKWMRGGWGALRHTISSLRDYRTYGMAIRRWGVQYAQLL
jgi:hypothetical protein